MSKNLKSANMNRSGEEYLEIKLLNVGERLSRPRSFSKINLFAD